MEDSLLNRAFDVKEITENFDPSVLPSDGHEYLQHVMYEASKCPKVVVADIDQLKLKKQNPPLEINSFLKTSDLVPSAGWQEKQLALFSTIRKKVELCRISKKYKPISLPKSHSEEKWHSICLGDENTRLEPSLSLLLSMNEPLIGRLLEYQGEWLDDGLKPNQGKWIYALLACVDIPLNSDTCSALRDLARKCATIRYTKNSINDTDVITLNLVICLVSKYFGQLDLAD